MHLPSFRGIRASSVLPAVLAGAVAVAGLTGVTAEHTTAPGRSFQLVSSTTPTDGMSYDMSATDANQFKSRYDAIINDIRNRVRGTTLYGNVVLAQSNDDYFPVTLAIGRSQITMVFNARNLYVVGWRNDATNTYYRLGEGPNSPLGSTSQVNLNWLNYTQMESAAAVGRGSLPISQGSIQGSIRDLGTATTANRDRARALLVLVQAFAEGARFDFLSYRVSEAIRLSHSFYTGDSSQVSSNGSNSGGSMIDVTGLDFENSWSAISSAMLRATRDRSTPHVRVGDGYLDTLSAIDAQLAVALRS
ncbi:ribosome-inactivating family protein [Streptomyces sp. NPDC004539]|uniref:ribosome-inactivating family protein n=1 Tax=Streptomyces sp. NPDC004539 TaxID=3154280 RepID=UPI0033B1C210